MTTPKTPDPDNTDFLNEPVNEGDEFYSAMQCRGYKITKKVWEHKQYTYHILLDTGEAGMLPEAIHRQNVINLGMRKRPKKPITINTTKRC